MKILAVDIGNTNINMGLFRGRRLMRKKSVAVSKSGPKPAIRGAALRLCKGSIPETIIASSVVPSMEGIVKSSLRAAFGKNPLIVGRDIKVPVRNLYSRPSQVGQDRLLNAYAGKILYKTPLIVIDFGTAVTFDIVSREGAYIGGIIVPGMEMSLEALAGRAALLPKVALKKPSRIFGRTTAECMQSGVFYGYAAMCDGLVDRIKKASRHSFKVVATGGNAGQIAKLSKSIKHVDEDLTLKAIAFLV